MRAPITMTGDAEEVMKNGPPSFKGSIIWLIVLTVHLWKS